jgi:hypothetical protein
VSPETIKLLSLIGSILFTAGSLILLAINVDAMFK